MDFHVVSTRVAIVVKLKLNMNCAILESRKGAMRRLRITFWISGGSFVNLKDPSL
jgi:hypothetical protein